MNQHPRFSLSMRLFHWGMVALLAALVAAGLTMVTTLEPFQLTLLSLHKVFGLLAFILVIGRLINRLYHHRQLPPLPNALSTVQKRVAKLSHWVLYALMLMMPLSGFFMQFYAGRPIEVFASWRLPAAVNVDIERYALLRELHGWGAYVLIGVVAVHALAALHHHFIRKDNVLKSML